MKFFLSHPRALRNLRPSEFSAKTRDFPDRKRAFSLIEVMVSVSILLMLMGVIFVILDSVSKVVNRAKATTASFEGARVAFNALTARLSEATLNPYRDYVNRDGNGRPLPADDLDTPEREDQTPSGALDGIQDYNSFTPSAYDRFSDLHFVSGQIKELLPELLSGAVEGLGPLGSHATFFQLPMGVSEEIEKHGRLLTLINTTGFFIEFNSESSLLPSIFEFLGITPKKSYRYRLMELQQPAERMSLYRMMPRIYRDDNTSILWLQPDVMNWEEGRHVLAENIIAMVLLPESAAVSPNYKFDSKGYLLEPTDPIQKGNRNRLPKTMKVLLVSIDEASAIRFNARFGEAEPFGATGVFDVGALFLDPDKIDDDLITLEEKLRELKVEYRIFSREILVKGAE